MDETTFNTIYSSISNDVNNFRYPIYTASYSKPKFSLIKFSGMFICIFIFLLIIKPGIISYKEKEKENISIPKLIVFSFILSFLLYGCIVFTQ